MALTDLLYLCPDCGAGTVEGKGGEAACSGCGTRFRAEGRAGGIRSTPPHGEPTMVPAHELVSRLESRDPALQAVRRGDEGILHRADALLRHAEGEGVLRHGDGILGFVEEFGPAASGSLVLTRHSLTFSYDDGGHCEWLLGELSAVQAASSSIQLTQPSQPLASLRFTGDSTRRWERLICEAVRRVWRNEGRGEVLEFQPRIRARNR